MSMMIKLNEKMIYPRAGAGGWARPVKYSGWHKLLNGRNSFWTNYNAEHRHLIVHRIDRIYREKIDVKLIDFTREYFSSKFGIEGVRIRNISINGSYVFNVSGSYVPGDIDSTIVVEHPFLAANVIIRPAINAGDGLALRDTAFVGTGMLANFLSHPKAFSELLSHMSGGIPVYGGYFPVSSIEKRYFLMHAMRLVHNGREYLIKHEKYDKALHRMIEARCIIDMIGGEKYGKRYIFDSNRIDLYKNSPEKMRKLMRKDLEDEMASFSLSAGIPLAEEGVIVHPNTPFDPPCLNFDDFRNFWAESKNPKLSKKMASKIIDSKDPNLILMLACNTNSKPLARIIRERILDCKINGAKEILNVLFAKRLISGQIR